MDINSKLAEELGIRPQQVEATVRLIDEGNTIPFIARYRKEATGALNDEVLRNLFDRLNYLRNLEERKATVIAAIEEQGKLTDELRQQIISAEALVVVEDLYRPYKQKRRTRATIARERGLEPLADIIWEQAVSEPVIVIAKEYVNADNDVASVEDAIAGARDIIAERISDTADYRIYIRELTESRGRIVSSAKDVDEESVFEMYYDFDEPIAKLPGHRILALNRGEKEKILTVGIEAPKDDIIRYLCAQIIDTDNTSVADTLRDSIADSYDRLIAPAIEREIRNALTERAEDGAIKVFGKNLNQLLMQPPVAGKVVLGWDPAFRTGCKLAVVDETGKVLDTTVIYPTAPQNKVDEANAVLKKLISKYHIDLISVGNGTASRESEQIIVDLLKDIPAHVQYVITNEAGASVYSASKLATEEFPNFDIGQRSAASIARRLQDPLAELVKIDPKSIGVGQYQHDMNQKKLGEALSGVVEDCVNRVGVDINTASASLLEYVSGINKTIARNIVIYREANGKFTSRSQILKVPKLGPKAYEQCAGFLRILDGSNPLDATAVHPESYAVASGLLGRTGHSADELASGGVSRIEREIGDISGLAEELGVGVMTLEDIIRELSRPGRDPREDMPKPILRSDVLSMEDLKPGMVLKGTVRNVIDFGAFVDIGVHQDGLVHLSQMSDRFINHPLDVVSVGDIVDVEVMNVDIKKQRIQLTMRIGAGSEKSSDRRNDKGNSLDRDKSGDKGKSRGKGGTRGTAPNRGRNKSGEKDMSRSKDRKRGGRSGGNHFFDNIVIPDRK